MTKAIGIDVSEGMVSEYNQKAQEAGIPPEKMSATTGNILGDAFAEDFKEQNFDVVFVGLALHHLSDPLLAMKRLVERLRDGGILWITEAVEQPPDHHEHNHMSPETKVATHTHGYQIDQVKDMFAQAGAGADVRVEVLDKPVEINTPKLSFKRTVFFARGKKL